MMATTSYCEDSTVQAAEEHASTPIWEEAWAWVALLPTLFITFRGVIQDDSAPYAFSFTAMAEDTLGQRTVRLVCFLIIVLLLATCSRSIAAASRKSKLLFLLPGIAFLSAVWSQNARHTVIEAFNLLFTTLFALYLYLRYSKSRLISFLLFGAFVALVICVLSVTVFPTVGIDPRQGDAWRGMFGQRNNCAIACVLFLVVALHARSGGLADQLMRGSVILLSLLFIVMSGSRQGWLLAALTIALTYSLRIITRIRSLDRVFILMVAAGFSVLLCYGIFCYSGEILALLDKDPTMSQRTIIWAQVLPAIAKHPLLGYGYSAFWTGNLSGDSMQISLFTGWLETQAQDGYLDILLQFGFFGLILVSLVFLRGFRQALAAIEGKWGSRATQMATVLLLVVLVENIGESSLLSAVGLPWFYALTAFLILGRPDRWVEESC